MLRVYEPKAFLKLFLAYCILLMFLEVRGDSSLCIMHSSVMVLVLILVHVFNMNSQVQHAVPEMRVHWPLCTAKHQTGKGFPHKQHNPLIALSDFALGMFWHKFCSAIDEEAFFLWIALLIFLGYCQGCCYCYGRCAGCYSHSSSFCTYVLDQCLK